MRASSWIVVSFAAALGLAGCFDIGAVDLAEPDASDTDADTDADADADADTDADTDTETETEDCTDAAYQGCGEDGDVHWFDSCGNEQEMILDCPDEHGACVVTSETTAACDCETGWDFETGCTTCEGGYWGDACENLCAFRVDGSSDSSGDGLSWAASMRTVQEGIDAARAEVVDNGEIDWCEVWVREGVYYIFETGEANTVQLQPGVLLYGGFAGTETLREERDFAGNETVLSGHGELAPESSVLHVVTGAADARIDGFTIRDGDAVDMSQGGFGGGMIVTGASPIVANCAFRSNSAEMGTSMMGGQGGAIFVDSGSPIIVDCVFESNTAAHMGGAISTSGPSAPEIERCVFKWNEAAGGFGGAVHVDYQGTAAIRASVFFQNGASEGGAVSVGNSGEATIEGCAFVENDGQGGGGIGVWSYSAVEVRGCEFVGNGSEWGGGGLRCSEDGTCAITDSVFTANTSADLGGGAQIGSSSSSEANATTTSCVFAGNTAANGGAGIEVRASTTDLDVTNCTLFGNSSGADFAAIEANGGPLLLVTNCVVWGNVGTGLQVTSITSNMSYTDMQGAPSPGSWGNLDADPLFALMPDEPSGSWGTALFDEVLLQTVLAVDEELWIPGELAGLFVQPDVADPRLYRILDNTESVVRVWGDLTAVLGIAGGEEFWLRDLRPGAGSPCVDAANGIPAPDADIDGNPRVDDPDVANTGAGSPAYVDMGAYERQP